MAAGTQQAVEEDADNKFYGGQRVKVGELSGRVWGTNGPYVTVALDNGGWQTVLWEFVKEV